MKKILYLALIALASCGDKADDPQPETTKTVVEVPSPVASFTISSELYIGQAATITNTSTNATAYSWDFGDGTTCTTATPVKSFTGAGNYTVKLTSGTSVSTKTVKVHNGTHGVQVKNNTTNTFKIILADRIDDNTLGSERFVIESIGPGQTSAVFYTSKTKIAMGGVFNGFNFVVMNPRSYTMALSQVNTININNDTQLTMGLTIP